MMKAVQKSFRVGEINPIAVGPMENFRLSNPPNASPAIIPAARAAMAAGSLFIVEQRKDHEENGNCRV